MGRGDARRKRSARQLRAQAEKHNIDVALLAPASKLKKYKEQDGNKNDGMPSSLRRMLQLKAKIEKNTQKGRDQNDTNALQGSKEEDKREGRVSETAKHSEADDENTVAQNAKRQKITEKLGKNQSNGSNNKSSSGSRLKERKKQFLKLKKLKKLGKLDQQIENQKLDIEKVKIDARAAATKPMLNEVADAPLEVHLRRKHWTGKEAGSKGNRLSKIFQQQIDAARAAQQRHKGNKVDEKQRMELAVAYREKKKGKNTSVASMESLAKLVEKGGDV